MRKHFFLLSLVLLMIFLWIQINPVKADTTNYTINHVSINMNIEDFSLNTLTASFNINTSIEGNLPLQNGTFITLSNNLYVNSTKIYTNGGYVYYLKNIPTNSSIIKYSGTSNLQIPVWGSKNFYPFDSYLANLTYQIHYPSYLNESKVRVSINTWPELWQAERYPKITVNNYETYSEVVVKIVLYRQGWDTNFFLTTFELFVLLSGMMYLIDIGLNKLAMFFTLIFPLVTILYYFTSLIPVKSSVNIAMTMYILLLTIIILLLISDIFFLFLKNYNIQIRIIQYIPQVFFPFVLIITWLQNKPNPIYSWVIIPNYIELWIIISFYFPFIIKEFIIYYNKHKKNNIIYSV